MAKSNSDSNGLRQDQPEWSRALRLGGFGGTHPKGVFHFALHRFAFGDPDRADRSGVTELPGLTSDSVLTADRRGGILISFRT